MTKKYLRAPFGDCVTGWKRVEFGARGNRVWILALLHTSCMILSKSLTFSVSSSLKKDHRTSLVVQWLRIFLPGQGTRVRALVQEDPTCHRATEPASHNYWARTPQLLKPAHLEPVLHNKRSHRSEKPVHRNKEQPLLTATREKPTCSKEDQRSQK